MRKVLTIEAKGEGEEVGLDKSVFTEVDILLTRICGGGIVKGTVKGFTRSSTTPFITLRRSLGSRPETGRRSEE